MKKKAAILISTLGIAAGAQTNNLPKIQENTKENISKTITTPKKTQTNKTTLSREQIINKNREDKKIEEIKKQWSQIDTNFKDIVVDQKLKYIKFTYKNAYTIKYEPEEFNDDLEITNIQTNNTYYISINNSLFKKDLEPKTKNAKKHTKDVKNRIEATSEIVKKIEEIKQKEGVIFNKDEPIMMDKNNIAYIIAEKKLKKGEKGYKERKEKYKTVYFQIEFIPEKKEGETKIKSQCKYIEINKNKYDAKTENML